MEEKIELREYFGIIKKEILDNCTYNNNFWQRELWTVYGVGWNYSYKLWLYWDLILVGPPCQGNENIL